MLNSELIKRIGTLPPLPQTVTEIEKVYQDPHVDAKRIAAIIEKDPMVVADLLKLLNSSYYGLRQEVINVEHAVSLLGMRSVKDLVISLSLRNMLRTDLSPYGIESETFAEISQFQALLAHRWMRTINPKKSEAIKLMALLQEIGKIVIADELLMEGEDVLFRAELEAGWDIREIERNYIDTTTAEVSAAMLRHWKFDEKIADAIQWADMPTQADVDLKEEAWVLRIASEAVSVYQPLSEKSCKKALNLATRASLPDDTLEEIMEDLSARWND